MQGTELGREDFCPWKKREGGTESGERARTQEVHKPLPPSEKQTEAERLFNPRTAARQKPRRIAANLCAARAFRTRQSSGLGGGGRARAFPSAPLRSPADRRDTTGSRRNPPPPQMPGGRKAQSNLHGDFVLAAALPAPLQVRAVLDRLLISKSSAKKRGN